MKNKILGLMFLSVFTSQMFANACTDEEMDGCIKTQRIINNKTKEINITCKNDEPNSRKCVETKINTKETHLDCVLSMGTIQNQKIINGILEDYVKTPNGLENKQVIDLKNCKTLKRETFLNGRMIESVEE